MVRRPRSTRAGDPQAETLRKRSPIFRPCPRRHLHSGPPRGPVPRDPGAASHWPVCTRLEDPVPMGEHVPVGEPATIALRLGLCRHFASSTSVPANPSKPRSASTPIPPRSWSPHLQTLPSPPGPLTSASHTLREPDENLTDPYLRLQLHRPSFEVDISEVDDQPAHTQPIRCPYILHRPQSMMDLPDRYEVPLLPPAVRGPGSVSGRGRERPDLPVDRTRRRPPDRGRSRRGPGPRNGGSRDGNPE